MVIGPLIIHIAPSRKWALINREGVCEGGNDGFCTDCPCDRWIFGARILARKARQSLAQMKTAAGVNRRPRSAKLVRLRKAK